MGSARGLAMLRLLIFSHALVLMALCTVLHAQDAGNVYKTVDENGRVIFTDRQSSGTPAELIKVQPTNTAPGVANANGSGSSDDKPANKAVSYTRFSITSPTNGQTLEYDVSAVDVTLALEPALHEGHQIQFILDGKPYDAPGTMLFTRFGNLSRGTHSVEARVLDAKGKRIKYTHIVKFTIQLHSEQQIYDDDGYLDYPRGVSGPRGADSIGGAHSPRDAPNRVGAESLEDVGGFGQHVVPTSRREQRH
jgi:hypothetical protein